MENGLKTTGQVAKILGIRSTTLHYWLIKGIIPFTETGEDGRGTHRYFSKSDIEEIRRFNEERKLAKAKYFL